MKNQSPIDLRNEYRALYYSYGLGRYAQKLKSTIEGYVTLWKLWETVVRRNQYNAGFSSTENY